ncbi:ankyrin repeat domain-containing protein [Wolbachia endosymbiont (group B) of Gerris lacustris]|uniref:ankyrin repeat domain-containing protein n=1 Tax=Wolbachia endosymbiont (group B) of Gerris lacustris TaxID=3066159 RepID=UPI00333F7AC3
MIGNLTYEDVKEFVINNPDITAQGFGEKLKQSGPTDAKICDLFMDVLRSGKSSVLNDYDTFLKIVELLAKSNIKIDIGDTTSKTVLDYAVLGGQPNVIKIFMDSGEFDQERKSNALLTTINAGKVQEFEILLDYIDHTKILDVLNTAPHNESTEIMKILLNNKRFTEEEKVQALSDASIDGDPPKVSLLLKHMQGIPQASIRNLLIIIKESQSSLGKELKIDSEFKGDPNNSDHRKYYSNIAIIKLLESSIEKKQEKQKTSNVKEIRIEPSKSNGNIDNRPVATVPPVSTSGNNNKNETPISTRVGPTVTPNNDKKANGFVDAQFSPQHKKETKYKESKGSFYTSLSIDVVGVVITGLFIAAAVIVPSVAGALVCSVLAILVVMATGLHVKNFTLPSYREMRENKVEPVNPITQML